MGRHVTQNVAIAFLVIGVAQFAFGLCVVVTTAVFGSKIDASVVEPYWSGLPLMLLGVVAVICGVMRASSIVVTYIVLAFFTTVVMFLSALFTGLASSIYNTAVDYMDAFGCFTSGHDCVCYTSSLFTGNSPREAYDGVTCGNLKSVHILLEVLVGLSVVGMVAAFMGLFLAGYALCRREMLSERLRESDISLRKETQEKNTEKLSTVVVDKQYRDSPSDKKNRRFAREQSPETIHYHRHKKQPSEPRPSTPEPAKEKITRIENDDDSSNEDNVKIAPINE